MGNSVGVPLIVFSRQDDNATTINNILRQAGHPVHCNRVDRLNQFEAALHTLPPELVIVFGDERGTDIAAIVELLSKLTPSPPLLIAGNGIDEQKIADAMKCGARDAVSLTHRNRLQAVVERELHAYRLKVALGGVVSSAKQYRRELRSLMDGTAEAIADVQEGIVVSANPPWLELFGHASEDDIVSLPFMDHCADADQEMLKGALVACLKQKWDGAPIRVRLHHADDGEMPVDLSLERVTIDGDPAVRITVPVESAANDDPDELVEQAVYKDPSTGFYQRHFFLERLDERLAQPLGGGVRALIYLRPDNFARVHDDIGILATEALLAQLASLLREMMQANDLYGRFGGTLFMALVERGNINDVEAWAEQLRKAIANQVFAVEQRSTSITCSIGVCEVSPGEGETPELLAATELACRKSRDAGGNRVQLSENTRITQSLQAQDQIWVPRLRAALMENRLRLVHQPINGLTEEVEGMFDTRVQMLDEQKNIVLASEFIPAAERLKMMKTLDRWVIGASLSFCIKKNPTLAFVRLSDETINDDTLFEWLAARLQSTGVDASQLCFQVSESVATQYLRQTRAVSERLRKMRFRFAVDHVASSREVKQILQHVEMDFMKIDGSLMQGLHRDAEAQSIVADLTKAARDSGVKSIAERVEEANTMAILWQLGVAFIQGHYVQMHGVVLEDTHTISGII